MKILVINDDGIYSAGLWAVAEVLADAGQVHVVAPDREQSGIGTALTLHGPIRATQVPPLVNSRGIASVYAVEGTPADSCILGLEQLVGPVDLVVSGINMGSNVGEDVLVSGTVGGALQGYLSGIDSIAISVTSVQDTRFDVAAEVMGLLAPLFSDPDSMGMPQPLFLNINVPNIPREKLEGVEVTRLGLKTAAEVVESGKDSRREYYWISRSRAINQEQEQGTDIWAVKHNRVSITPLHTRLTATDQVAALNGMRNGLLSRLFKG